MKRAFIGRSTPLGYEYRFPIRPARALLSDVPNPFLECTNGLLVSYDELWFPSREFCPKDLQDLSYVHFLEDEPSLSGAALVAIEQARDAFAEDEVPVAEPGMAEQQREAVRRRVPNLALDNHGRPTTFGTGDSASGELFLEDLLIAASLQFDVDLIVNSALARSVHAMDLGTDVGHVDAQYLPAAVEDITALRSLDFVTQEGSYHESIEVLRDHPRVREFREFLSSEAPNQRDASGLVAEVNRRVNDYAALAMDRYLKGSGLLFSAGSATIGAVGNLAHPGVGSMLSGALNVGRWLKERPTRQRVGWSMFVLDARRNNDREPGPT